MLYRLRRADGFTLIELLIVILIIGILLAVAIPLFLNQKSKAVDASAKDVAFTAQAAAKTVGAIEEGSYASIDGPASLAIVEKSIPTTEVGGSAYLSAATGTATTYTVTAKAGASSGDTFTISRNEEGVVTRTCTTAGSGGCPASGNW
jgi:prepilin-type N-terminal cleavage/methylation domain-containing protein